MERYNHTEACTIISILLMRIPLSTFNGSDIFSYRFTVHQVSLNDLIPFKVQDTQLHTS